MELPDDRELTDAEVTLVRWLLSHGDQEAASFLPQLDNARVASRCSCGCASINFEIDGMKPEWDKPTGILSDYEWTDSEDRLFGAFVFQKGDLLAGLELWSQDGLATPNVLPTVDQLRPIGTGKCN